MASPSEVADLGARALPAELRRVNVLGVGVSAIDMALALETIDRSQHAASRSGP